MKDFVNPENANYDIYRKKTNLSVLFDWKAIDDCNFNFTGLFLYRSSQFSYEGFMYSECDTGFQFSWLF